MDIDNIEKAMNTTNMGHEELLKHREVFMQNATYGMYKDGQIVFDEPDIDINNSRVLVVFLDSDSREQKLMDFFKIYGPWEDNRDIETIISDIQNSKISKGAIL